MKLKIKPRTTLNGWVIDNAYLTQEEMENNAELVAQYFLERDWSLEAICGMLGNMQSESTVGPGVVEGHATNPPTKGYGLIQWTNTQATTVEQNTLWAWIHKNFNDYKWWEGDRQCQFIDTDDEENWIATKRFPMSYEQFKKSEKKPTYLAMAYFWNRERGTWSIDRAKQAEEWYKYLYGMSWNKGGMPIYMYPSFANRIF